MKILLPKVSKRGIYFLSGLVMVFLIGSAAFYWYEFRPSTIRKDCYLAVMKKSEERINTDNKLTNDEANNLFRRCLVKNGIRAEDLVK